MGARVSCGDITLDSKAIAGQVSFESGLPRPQKFKKAKWQLCFEFLYLKVIFVNYDQCIDYDAMSKVDLFLLLQRGTRVVLGKFLAQTQYMLWTQNTKFSMFTARLKVLVAPVDTLQIKHILQ